MVRDDARGIPLPPMPAARAHALLARARAGAEGLGAAALAARAARLAAPLVLLAPTPAGRRRLARAVHAVGGRAGPLVTGDAPAGDLAPSTLLIDVTTMEPGVELSFECLADDGEPWLLVGATALADVPPAIRSAIGEVGLELPSLDAGAVALVACETLGALAPDGPAPFLEAEATAWLTSRPEARDLDVLTGWLRRALVVAAPGEAIGVRHLASIGQAQASAPAPGGPPPEPAGTSAAAEARLEYVLAELAHELRNPLVTLKTVADHLDELAGDEALRARFAGLAGEAVARMDGLLDNLVTYGRLGSPDPRPVEVAELLEAALRDAEPALAERGLHVRAAAGGAACLVDPEHLGFALKNLLVGIARAAAPDGEVLVDATANGVVRLRFASDTDAATLQRLFAPDDTRGLYDPTFQPLPFSLARAVLEKAGGRVDVAPAGEGGTALEVYLPVSDRPA